jgi:hypothetical protein
MGFETIEPDSTKNAAEGQNLLADVEDARKAYEDVRASGTATTEEFEAASARFEELVQKAETAGLTIPPEVWGSVRAFGKRDMNALENMGDPTQAE